MRRPTTEERAAAELRARQSLEARKGSPFTDEEWREAKANLKALFSLLLKWKLQAEQHATPDSTPPVTTSVPLKSRTPRTKKRRK
jgi:hypothetical protein